MFDLPVLDVDDDLLHELGAAGGSCDGGDREGDARTWNGETPLWLYILREASARHEGDQLGEVGGRIVAEILHGVVAADPESYLTVERGWSPTLPARGERFGLRICSYREP